MRVRFRRKFRRGPHVRSNGALDEIVFDTFCSPWDDCMDDDANMVAVATGMDPAVKGEGNGGGPQ